MTKKIKIYDLLPFMKKGWVAYDGKYWLYSTKKPNHTSWERWDPGYGEDNWNLNDIFKLEPFKGRWQDSLMLACVCAVLCRFKDTEFKTTLGCGGWVWDINIKKKKNLEKGE